MKTHRLIALLAVILLVASLTACNRSIQGKKSVSITPEGGAAALPTGGATDVLEQIYLFATQTAMATQGLTTSLRLKPVRRPHPARRSRLL